MTRRILFISRTLSTGYGGMQTQASSLIEALRRNPDVSLRVVGYGGRRIGLFLFFPYALLAALFTRAHTVHIGDALLSLFFPVLAVFRPRLKRTVTVHGLDIVWNRLWYLILIRRSLRFAHRVVAVSRATAGACMDLGIGSERIVVIPCGIVMPEISARKKPQDPVLLSLGRLVPRKGVSWFLENVFPLLLARHPTMRFVIAGDGPEIASLRSIVAAQNWQYAVEIVGAVPERAKESLFQNASLLIMPNIPVFGDMEGFGIAALEAASRGIPVVAADLEGLKDSVIEGVTGLRFLPLDLQSAAVAVESALMQEWNRDSMKKAVQEKFNIDSIASRYMHDVF
ncbi:MAG: glycosyltransferase family 4 protein [Candidatus Peribacteraceae bacterium]|nr:glycosyltransferase family 4 protein [Candidatus Peribacteraceae bacterium]MBP9850643.1 glycosyltransferase family 4 protein [Candidatus Peribacteraceae bacterium]